MESWSMLLIVWRLVCSTAAKDVQTENTLHSKNCAHGQLNSNRWIRMLHMHVCYGAYHRYARWMSTLLLLRLRSPMA
jgi:hypothetical protein